MLKLILSLCVLIAIIVAYCVYNMNSPYLLILVIVLGVLLTALIVLIAYVILSKMEQKRAIELQKKREREEAIQKALEKRKRYRR